MATPKKHDEYLADKFRTLNKREKDIDSVFDRRKNRPPRKGERMEMIRAGIRGLKNADKER